MVWHGPAETPFGHGKDRRPQQEIWGQAELDPDRIAVKCGLKGNVLSEMGMNRAPTEALARYGKIPLLAAIIFNGARPSMLEPSECAVVGRPPVCCRTLDKAVKWLPGEGVQGGEATFWPLPIIRQQQNHSHGQAVS
jgi:hypothetical protein